MTKTIGRIYALMLMVAVMGAGMVACDDDDDDPGKEEKVEQTHEKDELAILQRSLARVDKDGKLLERVAGVNLDAAVPDEVSIGVEAYEEAVEIFSGWFADTTVLSENGTKADFTVQQGSARLQKESGADGLVAVATFNVPGLKHVSKVKFILNSAWPENAGGRSIYKLGYQYQLKGFTGSPSYIEKINRSNWDPDELHTYVCIREYKNGKPALLAAISNNSYTLCWRNMENFGGNMPNEAKAKEISDILRSDWDFFVEAFNANGRPNKLNKNAELYIYSGEEHVFWVNTYTIMPYTGEIGELETKNHRHDRDALFYMETGAVQ